jgi:hypothetical protein
VSALDLFKMTLQLLQIAKVDLSAGRWPSFNLFLLRVGLKHGGGNATQHPKENFNSTCDPGWTDGPPSIWKVLRSFLIRCEPGVGSLGVDQTWICHTIWIRHVIWLANARNRGTGLPEHTVDLDCWGYIAKRHANLNPHCRPNNMAVPNAVLLNSIPYDEWRHARS